MKNQRIAKGFNRLATVYNSLARIVFGKTLERAQNHFLDTIKPHNRVLIVGGGAGILLKALLKQQPQITVDYIDISEKMIQLARTQTQNTPAVNFIVGTEQSIPDKNYSVIVTNFYLDLFLDATLPHIIQKIKTHSNSGTQWLVTDFVSTKNWHKIMLWIMYRFFRFVTGIEATRLPHWESHLEQAGFVKTHSEIFFKGFIKSVIVSNR